MELNVINKNPLLLPKDMIEQVKNLSTSLISDAMSGFGAMDYRIKPIACGMCFAGTALTVNLKTGSNLMLHTAIAMSQHGYVLVVSGKGDISTVVIGDLMTRAAKQQGVTAIVIDGLVRDIATLRKIGVPVFAIGAVPSAVEREGPGEINISVACGGVSVSPGDLIVGDDDGVVVVPYAQIEYVLKVAQEKAEREKIRVEEINCGNIMPQWLKQKIEEKGLSEILKKQN